MGLRVQITEYLDIDIDNEMWHCNRCGYGLVSARENYKKGCLVYDRDPRTVCRSITEAEWDYSPNSDWCRFVEFYCPDCGTLVEVDVLPPGHPLVHDVELDIDKLKEKYGRGR